MSTDGLLSHQQDNKSIFNRSALVRDKSELVARYRQLEKRILADTDPFELACHILEMRRLRGGL